MDSNKSCDQIFTFTDFADMFIQRDLQLNTAEPCVMIQLTSQPSDHSPGVWTTEPQLRTLSVVFADVLLIFQQLPNNT